MLSANRLHTAYYTISCKFARLVHHALFKLKMKIIDLFFYIRKVANVIHSFLYNLKKKFIFLFSMIEF